MNCSFMPSNGRWFVFDEGGKTPSPKTSLTKQLVHGSLDGKSARGPNKSETESKNVN